MAETDLYINIYANVRKMSDGMVTAGKDFSRALEKDIGSIWKQTFGRSAVGQWAGGQAQKSVTGMLEGMTALVTGIETALTGALTLGIETVINAVVGIITNGIGLIVTILLAIPTMIALAIGVEIIFNLLKGIHESLGGVMKMFEVMGRLIGQLVRPFVDLLIPFFMALNVLLLPLVRWMNLLMRPVFQALMQYVKENMGKVQKGQMNINDFMTGYVATGLTAVIGVVVDGLQKLAGALDLGMMGRNLWDWLSEKIPAAVGSIWDFFKSIMPPVVGNLGDWIIQTIPRAIGDLWSWLTDLVPKPTEDIWAWLGRVIGKVSGTIWDWLTEHIPGLALVSGYIILIGEVIKGLKDKWDNDWGPKITDVLGSIERDWNTWSKNISNIISDLQSKWEEWKVLIEKAIKDTCSALGWLTDPILNLKKKIEETLRGIGKAWEDWKTKIGDTVTELSRFFKNLLSPISDLQSAIEEIVRYIRGLINSIPIPDVGGGASSIANAIGGAIGYTAEQFGNIAGAASGMSWDSPAAQTLMGMFGYQFGGLVHETKPYLLHAGEEVIPKNEVGGREVNVYMTFNVTGSIDKATADYAVRLAEERFASSLRKYTRGYP